MEKINKIKTVLKAVGLTSILGIAISCANVSAAGYHTNHRRNDNYYHGTIYISAYTQGYWHDNSGYVTRARSWTRAWFYRPWIIGGNYGDTGRRWGSGTGESCAITDTYPCGKIESGDPRSEGGCQ